MAAFKATVVAATVLAVSVPMGGICAGFKVLHKFGPGTDGETPFAGLIRDKSGNLYGTSVNGGAHGQGTIYKVAADGTETILYSFTGGKDGFGPNAPLLMDKAGNLYTTVQFGGDKFGDGTLFELLASGGTRAVRFPGGAGGADPQGGVIADGAGNLYGTTYAGGTSGNGTVFEYVPGGAITVLYAFAGANGANPDAGVIRDKAGNLLGTVENGGAYGYGGIFKLAVNGSETLLYSFTGGSDGANPNSRLTQDVAGNIYTTVPGGGAFRDGAIFELLATGGTNVVSFTGANGIGMEPEGGVSIDRAGNLYGTTLGGGTDNQGTVFAYPVGGAITTLHSFRPRNDGALPLGGVIVDRKGHLFGTAPYGGNNTCNGPPGCGTVFELKK